MPIDRQAQRVRAVLLNCLACGAGRPFPIGSLVLGPALANYPRVDQSQMRISLSVFWVEGARLFQQRLRALERGPVHAAGHIQRL